MQSTGVTTKDLEDLSTAWLAMRRGLPVRAGERSGPIRVAKSAKLHALGSRHLERGGADMSERRSSEAQFQLANERTYLAWLRTALALVASGVAAARLLAGQTLPWAWETVGVLLIMAGRDRCPRTAPVAGDGRRDPRRRAPAGSWHRRDDRGSHRALRAHHHSAPARNEPRTRSMIGWVHPSQLSPGDRPHAASRRAPPEGSGPPRSRSAARRGLDRYNLEGEDAPGGEARRGLRFFTLRQPEWSFCQTLRAPVPSVPARGQTS
jgi:hypothetical protein